MKDCCVIAIETERCVFQTEFHHLQINITSRCNMKCEHCRGSYEGAIDLSLSDIETIIDFADGHLDKRAGYLISGGEPLLHPHFLKIMKFISSRRARFVSLTTNGSLLTAKVLDSLASLSFLQLRISISLDSIFEEEHNRFRNHPTAYDSAINATELVSNHPTIKCIVRTTIQKSQIGQLYSMAKMLHSFGVDIFSISSIIPVGRAKGKEELWFDAKHKKELLQHVYSMSKQFSPMVIEVNDPLRCLLKSQGERKEGVYGGCIAGIGSFSVEPNGDMLPCPLLHDLKIMNIKGLTARQILQNYQNSEYIQTLLERNFNGKCGDCKRRFTCGGCRARAASIYEDYLSEDPDCWI